MHKQESLWALLSGGFLAAVAYLIGGVGVLVEWFGVMMVIDYVTGVMAGWVSREVSSKIAITGFLKKIGYISCVIIAHGVDMISGSDTDFMRNSVLLILIGTEGISIIENWDRMGMRVPGPIRNAFKNFRGPDKK